MAHINITDQGSENCGILCRSGLSTVSADFTGS